MSEENVHKFMAKNGQEVILRPVVERDAKEIISSVKYIVNSGKYIQKEEAKSLHDEIRFINEVWEKRNMYTAVDIAGKVVGIARILRGDLEMKQHTGVFRTWIHPNFQGLGIGKEIMRYTLAWGRRERLHKLCLTVFSSNEKAASIYKRAGFVHEGTQKEQIKINGEYQDEIYMAYFFN